jgi:alpha,alpha-trehalose phosphorylase
MDLDDLEHNTGDGLHIASLAGAWIALVAGFGGLRDTSGSLAFAPRLPQQLRRLTFSVLWRGRRLCVTVTADRVQYSLAGGDPVTLTHHGTAFDLAAGEPVTLPIPPMAPGPRPQQPPGRAPAPRHPRG